ncbi:uncharacterized protein LOC129743621 [Uranotaenia lowii]|uniref:uncharacterized protein LOC129743621 n=1 Tax=Uranotaenia lowii TaxID=190385 RepID=UPI0024789619|nr:uncharacterized protein LOC129743621 [Uranotaenia lowii]
MLKLVVCLSVIGLVASYDFKDSFYNEHLMEDLLDDRATLTLMDRFKRAAADGSGEDKCKRQNKHKCCNDSNEENLDKIKELKKECYNEVKAKDEAGTVQEPIDFFSCEKINKTKQDIVCTAECVGRKKNVIDEKGDLLAPAVLIPFVKENFAADAWQEPLIAGFVDTCLKEVADKKATRKDEYRCNPASSHFGYCMWRQMTLACPKEMQESSKKCDKIREKLAKNEPVSMYKSHDFDDN